MQHRKAIEEAIHTTSTNPKEEDGGTMTIVMRIDIDAAGV
jgi:hypothetical protein